MSLMPRALPSLIPAAAGTPCPASDEGAGTRHLPERVRVVPNGNDDATSVPR